MRRNNALATTARPALLGLAVAVLVACGSTSNDSSWAQRSGERDAIGNNVGPLLSTGAVYVNDVHYTTDGTVTSDDGIDRIDQLEQGMILRVNGSWTTTGEGEAYEIFYDDLLRGPLSDAQWESANQTGKLEMLGQTVWLDSRTRFSGLPITDLISSPSAYQVRVSGWYREDGSFLASWVSAAGHDSQFDTHNQVELEGRIANLDQLAETFRINNQHVTYDFARFETSLDEAELSSGMMIQVEGKLEHGVLIASRVERQGDHLAGREGDDLKLSGAILGGFDAVNRRFSLNGFTVQVSDITSLDRHLQENMLAGGVQVSAQGQVSGGVLLAEDIALRTQDTSVQGLARVEQTP